MTKLDWRRAKQQPLTAKPPKRHRSTQKQIDLAIQLSRSLNLPCDIRELRYTSRMEASRLIESLKAAIERRTLPAAASRLVSAKPGASRNDVAASPAVLNTH